LSGLRGWLEQTAQRPAAVGEESVLTRFTQLAVDVLPDLVQTAIQIFLFLIFLGLGLLLIVLLGAVFLRERKNKEPAS